MTPRTVDELADFLAGKGLSDLSCEYWCGRYNLPAEEVRPLWKAKEKELDDAIARLEKRV